MTINGFTAAAHGGGVAASTGRRMDAFVDAVIGLAKSHIVRVFEMEMRAWESRRAELQAGSINAHTLRDIGLSRTSIEMAICRQRGQSLS